MITVSGDNYTKGLTKTAIPPLSLRNGAPAVGKGVAALVMAPGGASLDLINCFDLERTSLPRLILPMVMLP